MDPTFFKYIFRFSWKQQLFLLVLTILSFPFLYFSLELPKTIINKAIGSEEFPRTEFGFELSQVEYLMVLCAVFLALVAVNGSFKYYINVYKGRLGERMLRRLRYALFSRVLRFPTGRFRRVSPGEIIAMITAEVEPLGGFIGDAVALPAFQGGTLLTILVFMFVQDPVLGLAAVALYPLQIYAIPKLQRQVNLLAKERVRTVRRLSERVGETVTGIEEVHVHDTSEWHRADFARYAGRIYDIRFRIYRKKFFIKFLNNFIAQLTPFFFFSIGGYLVIEGDLTFGALVAVLSAYKDLSSPWKELLDWYQQKEDTRIKYEQLVEQFELPDLMPEALQRPTTDPVPRLVGQVVASNLALTEEGGVRLLDGVSFHFEIGDRVAFVGAGGAGADIAARILARLVGPTAGSVTIGGLDLSKMMEAVVGRRLAYVGAGVSLGQGTIRDNIVYGLKHRPSPPAADPSDPERERELREAEASGNTTSDPAGDWIDYRAIEVDGPAALMTEAMRRLRQVDLEDEVFAFGLNGTVDAAARPELARAILRARHRLRERLEDDRYGSLLEPFRRDRFNHNMSVAENLLFSRPIGPVFDLAHNADNVYVRSVLDLVGLARRFRQVGLDVARIMVDLFEDLPPGHELFERFRFVDGRALPELQAAIRRIDAVGIDDAEAADVSTIMGLPFQLVPARHRLGVLDAEFERRLLEARRVFAEHLPVEYRGAIAFFEADSFNVAASIQDNILFGKLAYGRQQSQAVIGGLMAEVIDELGLRPAILEAGLDFDVGVGGRRLSASQRQKLALARALLKRPDLLILDGAIAALDPRSQAAVRAALLTDETACGLVWVSSELDDAGAFHRIVRFEAGTVVEQNDGGAVRLTRTDGSGRLAAAAPSEETAG
jgi:ABC-type multidrug transport system fused ATPase/permease subunit